MALGEIATISDISFRGYMTDGLTKQPQKFFVKISLSMDWITSDVQENTEN